MKTLHGSVRFLLKQNGNVYCDTWGSPGTFRSLLCSEPCGLVVCSKEGFSSNVLRFVQSHPTLGTTPTSPQDQVAKLNPGTNCTCPGMGRLSYDLGQTQAGLLLSLSSTLPLPLGRTQVPAQEYGYLPAHMEDLHQVPGFWRPLQPLQ